MSGTTLAAVPVLSFKTQNTRLWIAWFLSFYQQSKLVKLNGGHRGNRTHDRLLKRELLYQLSYVPASELHCGLRKQTQSVSFGLREFLLSCENLCSPPRVAPLPIFTGEILHANQKAFGARRRYHRNKDFASIIGRLCLQHERGLGSSS